MKTIDITFMARAIQLARHGLYSTSPNPRVGCILVKAGEIIAQGWHVRAGEPHAEIHALRQAGEQARGAIAYVTLEPCCHHGRTPPCSQALFEAGVERVVVGMQDPNPQVAGNGLRELAQHGIDITTDVLLEQAQALNPGFIKRMRYHLPFVRTKLGMSLDGRTAMASGESQWITGPEARQDVQRLRARSCAILTGIGTVLADDPSLNVRDEALIAQRKIQPLRVIVDSQLRMTPTAKLLNIPGQVLIATCSTDEKKRAAFNTTQVKVIQLPSNDSRDNHSVDLAALLRVLATQQINEVLVEGGARINGSLLSQGLLDEMVIYMAPTVLGDAARGLFHLPLLTEMKHKIQLTMTDVRAIGRDWRVTATPLVAPP